MIKLIYAVFDSKGNCYSEVPLFQFKSHGDAKRAFSDLVNDVKKENVISLHPEDYSLMYLGEYNVSTGCFTNSVNAPENLGIGSSFVVSKMNLVK